MAITSLPKTAKQNSKGNRRPDDWLGVRFRWRVAAPGGRWQHSALCHPPSIQSSFQTPTPIPKTHTILAGTPPSYCHLISPCPLASSPSLDCPCWLPLSAALSPPIRSSSKPNPSPLRAAGSSTPLSRTSSARLTSWPTVSASRSPMPPAQSASPPPANTASGCAPRIGSPTGTPLAPPAASS